MDNPSQRISLVNKLYFTLICTLVFAATLQAHSQENKPFACLSGQTAEQNIYSIEIQQLPGFFERACLAESIFADSRLLLDRTDLNAKVLVVLSNKENATEDIISALTAYCWNALKSGQTLSPAEKEVLLGKFKKYR